MYVFPLPRKMMKKCSSKVLAMAMVVAMMVPGMNVFAADTANGTSAADTNCATTVKYTVTEGYTWQVPATITFEKDAGASKTRTQNGDVKVTKNVIGEGKTLKISIASDEDFLIKTGTNTTLSYTVKKTAESEALGEGGEVLSVSAGTYEGTQNLIYTLSTTTGTAEVAGDYEGTLNYVASIN